MAELSVSKQDIIDGLRRVGLKRGANVIVHSSLSAFGKVDGGADSVVDAMIEIVDKNVGTIIMPCFTYDWQPGQRFDWTQAQSTWTGKIPQTFGERPGVKRGKHPLYNVAVLGPLADWVISVNDLLPLSWGIDKFYYQIKDRNGSVLLLGVDHNSNSTIHVCQELADVPHIANKKPMSKLTLDELMRKPPKEQEDIIELHMSSMETIRDFNKIEPILLAHKVQKITSIGKATVRYMYSKDVIEIGTEALKKNPRLLVASKT